VNYEPALLQCDHRYQSRKEISKVLRRFGCESIGFMDDYQQYEVLLAFKHRNRQGPVARIGEGVGADVSQGKPVDL
jgi:hypothetical protein